MYRSCRLILQGNECSSVPTLAFATLHQVDALLLPPLILTWRARVGQLHTER